MCFRLLQEKDAAEKESRDKETKILNLNTNAKQKQQNDMKDFEQQVQAQMKDFGRELDEAGCARDEMQGPFKGNLAVEMCWVASFNLGFSWFNVVVLYVISV
ncbi:hypothetical protein DPMN_131298 [Dreissena polymorpha]|uniref:Uncharacterized protein n=1 Tax=Dreissena polymorpha TaxID=45954 RepID=A0A9D4H6Q0_DREPO|nr:hypothetical protein DPMN_131298 [Dreissena polymorpha]